MKTTLAKIRSRSPCIISWKKLLAYLGKTEADDDPLAITTILDSNGIMDAIWCFRAVDGRDKEIRLFGVWCARRVQHLMTDPNSIAAVDVAERFANGLATKQELVEARHAAGAVAWDIGWDTTAEEAWAAAGAASIAAAMVSDAEMVSNAAWASWVAERAAQERRLRELCAEVAAWQQ